LSSCQFEAIRIRQFFHIMSKLNPEHLHLTCLSDSGHSVLLAKSPFDIIHTNCCSHKGATYEKLGL
jgi:hypothetical protein